MSGEKANESFGTGGFHGARSCQILTAFEEGKAMRSRAHFKINCRAAALGFALAATAAVAHHSANMFDLTRTVEVKGTVKEFHWTNPHSWVVIDSLDAAGKTVAWSFEGNGPGYLVRNGWKRESLKPGDKVTITANPMRDGSAGGNLVNVVLPDGRQLSARVGGPPAAGAAPYAAPPNTAEGSSQPAGAKP
jgi:hypothetical protein